MPDTAALEKRLGIEFTEPALLSLALVHSSYVNENPAAAAGHNERLEFLGDAVLDFVVAERLYRDFPDLSEGQMTRLRSALVRRETLARIARSIGLGEYLVMGKGEEASGGRDKSANLAGALEAVIAAVYLDRGVTVARRVIVRLLEAEWPAAVAAGTGGDEKSRLQELTQARFQLTPDYRLLAETGPDHDKQFTVEVTVNGEVMGSGTGSSKKLAEKEAARAALERLKGGFTK
jgi:ribonuclease-3